LRSWEMQAVHRLSIPVSIKGSEKLLWLCLCTHF
jgi:hypothetical protein